MRFFVLLLFFASSVTAQPLAVTNTFSNNSVADATEINQNFTDIVNGVNAKLLTDNISPFNTAIGFEALLLNTTGIYNTGTGIHALYSNTEGSDNTAVGALALYLNNTGSSNTAVGWKSLYTNSGGSDNTALGATALYTNSTGGGNTAIGRNSLYNNIDGNWNTANGLQTLYANTSGDHNTANGHRALHFNTTGDDNTATGAFALYINSEGEDNTANGGYALYRNTEGSLNAAIGYKSLYKNTTGGGNVAIGYASLYDNTTGDVNTAVGNNADVSAGDLVNATALGYFAIVNASNKIRLGNTSVTAIEGQVSFTTSSDERLKESITPIIEGLALVSDLNPVSYHRTNNPASDIEMGLLAQEVEAVLEKHGLGNSGMVHQPTEDAYMSLRYNDLLAPMIKAIQELDEKNQTLEAQLKSQLEELLTIVQAQQEQIAQLQQIVEHQFAAR